MKDNYFNGQYLPRAKKEYIAFIDIMGTRTHMSKSVMESANFIFKFHAAIISAWREQAYPGVFVYPVMDGAYITSKNKSNLIKILLRVFRVLSSAFLEETNFSHLYLVRGAIAYDEVIHGHNVPYEASKAFEMNIGYKDTILLGKGMINVYDRERDAAPFGIYVDDSACRSSQSNGSFSKDWKWFKDPSLTISPTIAKDISTKIEQYLMSLKNPNNPLHYPDERIDCHLEMAKQYFEVEL